MKAYISSISAMLCIACITTAAAYEPHKDDMEAIEIPHSAETKELASECLTRMYAAMAQPNSGRVKVSFTAGDEPPYDFAITFDKGWDRFRCNAEPLPEKGLRLPPSPGLPNLKSGFEMKTAFCFSVQEPTPSANMKRISGCKALIRLPLDPRGCWAVLSDGFVFQRMDLTLEIYKKKLSEQSIESYASKSKDGEICIVSETDKPDRSRHFLWLDPKCHPFRSEMWAWIESKKTWWHQSTAVVRRAVFSIMAWMCQSKRICSKMMAS